MQRSTGTTTALPAATYHVEQMAEGASDANPGTREAPWKTIARAAAAEELRPGDTVLIHSGVYREHVDVTVSGEPGNPITLAAAPGARVVVKGSELVRGKWTKLADEPDRKEPYPRAFAGVWKIQLGEECFTDPRFQRRYRDKSRRWVSQVFINDTTPLQQIGPDPIYRNEEYLQLATVGRGLEDIIPNSFFFDPADQTLYIKIAGKPAWLRIEVGVRGFALTARDVHDVVVRGIELRHNRQPSAQWPLVSIHRSQRVVLEACQAYQSDFCGLSLYGCQDCTVRKCDLSHNGNTGLGMSKCGNCLVEGCTLLANNYRRFHSGWAAAAMKCIPGNTGCTIRHCEVAYNNAAHGIWFDGGNADIRILGNVCHHNGGAGIFFEINKGGGLIADNLSFANRARGIYISGSQNTWVVHNTVACNGSGIVAMPRGEDWPLENVHIQNNLLIRNYVTAETVTRGCDLTLYMGCPEYGPYQHTIASNHADYNVYANNGWTPSLRHTWNPNNTLLQWQDRFQQGMHSMATSVAFELQGARFAVRNREDLAAPGPLPEAVRSILPKIPHVGSRCQEWPSGVNETPPPQ